MSKTASQQSAKGKNAKSSASPVALDTVIGRRIREVREAAGLSQPRLASQLGVSHQQPQKYETAANRISASRLHHLCEICGVKIETMFRSKP